MIRDGRTMEPRPESFYFFICSTMECTSNLRTYTTVGPKRSLKQGQITQSVNFNVRFVPLVDLKITLITRCMCHGSRYVTFINNSVRKKGKKPRKK